MVVAPVLVVLGSCGLDRLITLDSFPKRDSKVRTRNYTECGGGNAANTAVALSRLGSSVRLLTVVGDDPAGQWLYKDLAAPQDSTTPSIDLRFVQIRPGTTTGLTHILVDDTTRTCLHTKGTCGAYDSSGAVAATATDGLWDDNVVHVHTDGRHTDAALAIAREARRRGIPVSVDVEKDRNSVALDALVAMADIVFTNQAADKYWARLVRDQRQPLINDDAIDNVSIQPEDSPFSTNTSVLLRVLRPMFYYKNATRAKSTYPLVVYTHGELGSTSVQYGDDQQTASSFVDTTTVRTTTSDHSDVLYQLTSCGALANINVVDTTGAGDAFIGGYLHAIYCYRNDDSLSSTMTPSFRLQFANWVAGNKVTGAGAQRALPTASDVTRELGNSKQHIQESLRQQLNPFQPPEA